MLTGQKFYFLMVFFEFSILFSFCLALFCTLLCGFPLLYALIIGLGLFACYGVRRTGLRQTLSMCFNGIKTTRSILLLFLLLGLLTSTWRAAGTIPVAVSLALKLIRPDIFLLLAFLLNSAMSLLTGTALGTAATMGVLCATIGRAIGIDPAWMGGAILAGVYFGNRISPISSMALLTASITHTNIYDNIRQMLKTTWLPFLLSCIIYLSAGANFSNGTDALSIAKSSADNISEILSKGFSLSPWSLVPAIAIVILSLARVKTSHTLFLSSLCAFFVALFVEKQEVATLFKSLIFGYKTMVPELSKMIDGGGLLSMTNVFLIVIIAGCFGGIFKGTPILQPLQKIIEKISSHTTPFFATLISSSIISCVVCNQTLTIILTNQMTENLKAKNHALNLYDTAVTVIALVPWSVATAIVLNTAQAPNSAVLCACFLYLLPICRLLTSLIKSRVFKKS